ncbi:unnamed protein product [Brassicogethes aeneus]|uniref:Uncharacterized protein n=1 Tax=Brassicogethes aeneus TaxID=1431903 RepID=A0A9P0B140_BRAAE|nr:unnamed protein product [Brassicogethes aeneus]
MKIVICSVLNIFILATLSNVPALCQHPPTPMELIHNLFKTPPKLGPTPPTPAKFIENLMNETLSEIATLSRNFYFRDVKDKDVKFYLFRKEKPYIEDVTEAPHKDILAY